MKMKKTVLSVLIFLALTVSVFAQETQADKNNTSSLSYRNVTVHKVLDHNDAYIVLYAKNSIGVGQVIIPKTWSKENPRKLQFRALPKGLSPFMSVVYKDGTFHKVILTMPVERTSNSWGVASATANIQNGLNTETLDIVY